MENAKNAKENVSAYVQNNIFIEILGKSIDSTRTTWKKTEVATTGRKCDKINVWYLFTE